MLEAMEGRSSVAGQREARSHYAPPGEVVVERALLSVSDKRGIVEFARGLVELGVEIVSTGGTARELQAAGVPARSISDFTGFPEIMDGRVKTLHPRLYGGLLCRRDEPLHLKAAEEQGIEFVDLVCVNLYPFESTVGRRGVSDEEAIEQIDIGGPAMIRAAAKNFPFAAVVVRPESYDAVLEEVREGDRRLSLPTRESLAGEAFAYTARYDTSIARWFSEKREEFPGLHVHAFEKETDLPYGENPHQRAAYYSQVGVRMHLLSMIKQHGGRELSFNNLLDLNAGRLLMQEFKVPACAIIKHNNPSGCAMGKTWVEAYRRAFATDPVSAFGGIICTNGAVDLQFAQEVVKQFAELIFAPAYTENALELLLSEKPNLRVLEDNERRAMNISEPDTKRVIGGMLLQDRDMDLEDPQEMQVVTGRQPTNPEWDEMKFAWRVCKHVRSNAIVLSKDQATAGIGAGQMSRVDSVRLAVEKAQVPLQGAAMASDAFFPFPDGPLVAIDAGVTAIIQPGGSVRDLEVVEAADRAGIAMVFTRRRHFRH
jgi:phosphoribosylaminoimidazolecarboxamide formyltransferase / IMP cyclohydrolase